MRKTATNEVTKIKRMLTVVAFTFITPIVHQLPRFVRHSVMYARMFRFGFRYCGPDEEDNGIKKHRKKGGR